MASEPIRGTISGQLLVIGDLTEPNDLLGVPTACVVDSGAYGHVRLPITGDQARALGPLLYRNVRIDFGVSEVAGG